MKRLMYLMLLTPFMVQSVRACTVCNAQMDVGAAGGSAVRQAEGGAWGQTQPAYRGAGSAAAAATQFEGGDDYEENEEEENENEQ